MSSAHPLSCFNNTIIASYHISHTQGSRVTACVITFSKYKMQPNHEYKEASLTLSSWLLGSQFLHDNTYLSLEEDLASDSPDQKYGANINADRGQMTMLHLYHIMVWSRAQLMASSIHPDLCCSPSLGRLLPSPSHLIKQSEPKIIDMILQQSNSILK